MSKTVVDQKTEIKKIVIDVEGKELVLTVAAAKKLKALLNELFEVKVIREDRIVTVPESPWRHYPYKPYWDHDKIWLGDNGSAKFLCSNNTLKCELSKEV